MGQSDTAQLEGSTSHSLARDTEQNIRNPQKIRSLQKGT